MRYIVMFRDIRDGKSHPLNAQRHFDTWLEAMQFAKTQNNCSVFELMSEHKVIANLETLQNMTNPEKN